MPRVNHINIVKVCRCRLVCNINRVVKGQIPNREGFKFCIACLNATLVFVIKLRKAGCHFSASGTRCSDYNKLSLSFDIIIFAVALLTYNMAYACRVAVDKIVMIAGDTCFFKLIFKGDNLWGGNIFCQHNTAYHKSLASKSVNKPENINIVCDAKVTPDFIFFNILGTDNYNNLSLVLKLKKHLQLAVRLKARKNS